ncbi:MAG: methyltransferase domain-containing protein [bacterium]|nr:methyltransferase domain-containing protein [bacterium]
MFFKKKKDELRQTAESVPFWWHSIDLGRGVVTAGRKSAANLGAELAALEIPPLRGKTFLDVGAWDGYFSFAAERRGARRVLALDHYVWSMDLVAQERYWRECREKGITPQSYEEIPGIWRPEELPGKQGFDTAREALGSRVEERVADFMTMDLRELGVFDVVLYKGVLYHIEDPLAALRRLARVTGELAIIETAAVVVPGFEHHAFCEFFESDELNFDPGNWWAPNEKALHGMCRAAGFAAVETRLGPPAPAHCPAGEITRYRAVVHAGK